MQFQADLLGVPVVRPQVTETTALGAAYLVGLAAGFWESRYELARNWMVDRRFETGMSRDQALELRHQWSRALERARAWQEEQMREVRGEGWRLAAKSPRLGSQISDADAAASSLKP